MNNFLKIGSHSLQTEFGKFNLHAYLFGNKEQNLIVLTTPLLQPDKDFCLRIQYGCLHSTALFSLECDCARQIKYSLQYISNKASGVYVFFPDHEGMGLGLAGKIRIEEEEERTGLTFPKLLDKYNLPLYDKDDLWVIPQILSEFQLTGQITLLTDSPFKERKLKLLGVNISNVVRLGIETSGMTKKGMNEIYDKKIMFGYGTDSF
jgi:GTP cyclohydrolase II